MRKLGWVLAGLLLLGLLLPAPGAGRARAQDGIACGDVLGPGNHVLQSDLACDTPVGLTLTSGAHLNMDGHTVTCVNGAEGVGIRIAGSDVHLNNGHVHGCGTGILLYKATESHVNGMHVDGNLCCGAGGNGDGIRLRWSHDNHINGTTSAQNEGFGVALFWSTGNTFNTNQVNDNVGPPGDGGYLLFKSHRNTITSNQIARNGVAGILLRDSSDNRILGNTVVDTNFHGDPRVNIAVQGNSDHNLFRSNVASSTAPGIALDGIHIGCRDGCPGLGGPSTGADNNLVQSNTATGNARYGIAQAAGNSGNTYIDNTATGNGVADVAIDP